MEAQEQGNSQTVSFRCTPQTKMLLHTRATALGLNISEYLNAVIHDYEEHRQKTEAAATEAVELRKEKQNLFEKAKELAANVLTKDQIKQIREQAVKEYQENEIKNGIKSPYIEVNKGLKDRLTKYETAALKAAFAKVKGKQTTLPGQAEKLTFNDLPDLVTVLVELFRADEQKGGNEQ